MCQDHVLEQVTAWVSWLSIEMHMKGHQTLVHSGTWGYNLVQAKDLTAERWDAGVQFLLVLCQIVIALVPRS